MQITNYIHAINISFVFITSENKVVKWRFFVTGTVQTCDNDQKKQTHTLHMFHRFPSKTRPSKAMACSTEFVSQVAKTWLSHQSESVQKIQPRLCLLLW